MTNNLQAFLDDCYRKFNIPTFIDNDPIGIPHLFSKRQDIEITAFWTAMLAWGQRKTIINSATRLFNLMDNAPHDFIVNHIEKDRQRFLDFKHRTFQPTDTLYFLEYLQHFYKENDSLEFAFSKFITNDTPSVSDALIGFHDEFFSLAVAPSRTKKHIATPV